MIESIQVKNRLNALLAWKNLEATQIIQNMLELLQIKNRQMNITNLRLMKNQAVTKAIQMFPPPFCWQFA